MSERQESFTISEIERIGCVCSACGAEIIFKLSTVKEFDNKCHSCGTTLYPLKEIIAAYKAAHDKVVESKLTVKLLAKPSQTVAYQVMVIQPEEGKKQD